MNIWHNDDIPDGLKQFFTAAPQLGLERTPEEYVANMVEVFREVRRVLRNDGTLWLNLGDSYAANRSYQVASTKGGAKHSTAQGFDGSAMSVPDGLKPKDLVGIPWRTAFALQADGWWLRQDVVWSKPNPMTESVRDRCTKSHEYLFLLTKSAKYFFDAEAIKEESTGQKGAAATFRRETKDHLIPGQSEKQHRNNRDDRDDTGFRNKRSVWRIATSPFKGAHFATFPPKLVEPCILAGTSAKGCCPECGKPWVRVTERTKLRRERPNDYTKRTGEEGTGNSCANSVAGVEVKTTGWQQSCKCEPAEPVPCIVADIFGGSGTTGMVAAYHGRDWLLFELNPDYAALAEQRIAEGYTPPKVKKPKRIARFEQMSTQFELDNE